MIAVVTGGASGIGAAVAEVLGRNGATTVVWDVQPGGARGEKSLLMDSPHLGTDAFSLHVICDVSDPAAVDEAMARTLADRGVPDVLVTAAGVAVVGPLVEVDVAAWDHVYATNVRGTMLCVRAVARAMTEAGKGGAIVCVSSLSGRMPTRNMAAYCSSKAAVDMFVKVVATELGPHGIRVNAIAPGITATPMNAEFRAVPGIAALMSTRTPLQRIAEPDMIADAVLMLLRTDWVTGHTLVADGGFGLYGALDV